MPLNVTLVTGATSYRLKVEQLSIVIDRSPLQAGLPGGDPIIVDLGQFLHKIVLTGIIDESTPPTDGGVAVPTKNQIEDIATDDFNNTITITFAGDTYTAKVKSVRFTLKSAAEDRWDYDLQFVAISRT